jgi:hypothetical protein
MNCHPLDVSFPYDIRALAAGRLPTRLVVITVFISCRFVSRNMPVSCIRLH